MKTKIILIGNYTADKQFSMQIFEALMAEGYSKSKFGVSVMRPNVLFGKMVGDTSRFAKWFGYIDKFLLFPLQLLLKRTINFILFQKEQYHICDHSNAFYLYFLPKNKTLISCHDVLAIRAGLGYPDTYCTATKSGEVLQRIILNALSGARKLAAVSEFTLNQLREIDTQPQLKKNWICIHNALSEKFVPLSEDETQKILGKFESLQGKAFLLHVGSGLERKNRKVLIGMIYELKDDWDGLLVLAGAPLNTELHDLINKLGVSDRILEINRPTDMEIIALYSSCEAMIFPSYSEGFGWPIIEAQACGAPVITSNKAPMMSEVGGRAALYADPDDASSFADQLRKLKDTEFRKEVICLGHENSKRFDFKNTMHQYIELISK
ncbi:glycosyltransferase family 4 protein [Flavobacterium sp. DSR3-2]|uniref:glycosyltransferase family 4 protein n=1 Tax=Flavobacterium sp. DSR3-2 TaxID=2804634 RepID=UPI003CEDDC5F